MPRRRCTPRRPTPPPESPLRFPRLCTCPIGRRRQLRSFPNLMARSDTEGYAKTAKPVTWLTPPGAPHATYRMVTRRTRIAAMADDAGARAADRQRRAAFDGNPPRSRRPPRRLLSRARSGERRDHLLRVSCLFRPG
jgi:hypothetical protein